MSEVIEIPIELTRFELPQAVQARLQFLLDRQDDRYALFQAERHEADWLNLQNFYPCCVCALHG